MSVYFQKPKYLGTNVKVQLDLSNYTTKASVKVATGVDTLDFVKKIDLTSLNFHGDKVNIDKLKDVQFKQFGK